MSSWVSQGVLLGATGATGSPGSTGATGPTGGQSTTTTSSFTMPAVGSTVTIAVVSAAWTKLGQVLFITDGTSFGIWEITTRTSATALVLTNRGFPGAPASGTMATAATVQLIGYGQATATLPGAMPRLGAVYLTTNASFTIPALAFGVAVTVGSVTDIIGPSTNGNQVHYITDGTHYMIASLQSIAGLVVTYSNLASNNTGGTMSAGRVYMGWMPALQDQQQVLIGGGSTLIGSPGFLNTLLAGSAQLVITPAAAGGGNITVDLGVVPQSAITGLVTALAGKVASTDTRVTQTAWQRYNAIRNPEMIVAQRGVGPTAVGGYGIDGWVTSIVGTSFAATWTQILVDIPADTSGNNWYPHIAYAHRVAITTGKSSLAAGDSLAVYQPVEGNLAQILKDNPTSISFLVRSSVAGTFSVILRNVTGTNYYVANTVTIASANVWQRVTIQNIPAFTSSSTFPDGTAGCYYFLIGLASGATNSSAASSVWTTGAPSAVTGQTNFGATTGITFDFTAVQHEPNSVCTPYIKRELAAEIQLNLRYLWNQSGGINLGYTENAFWTRNMGLVVLPAPMRSTPTVLAGSVYTPGAGSAGTIGISGNTLAVNLSNASNNWTTGTSMNFTGGLTAEL